MSIEQTHGHEATAYFNGNEVKRVDYVREKIFGHFLFLEHKIAHLLFPENFIEVIRENTTETLADLKHKGAYTRQLFSKKAQVPTEHALFTGHNKDFLTNGPCKCVSCINHQAFHNMPEFHTDVYEAGMKIAKAGIRVPFNDQTDYCLGRAGVIFFEFEDINLKILEEYLSEEPQPKKITEVDKVLIDYLKLRFEWATKVQNKSWLSTLHSLNSSRIADILKV